MGKLKDLMWRRFGDLVVVDFIGKKGKTKSAHWLCICKCGNEKVARGSHLASGNIKSCGCRLRSKYSEHEQLYRCLYSHRKAQARSLNIEWNLTYIEFYQLVISPCYYCGENNEYKTSQIYINGENYNKKIKAVGIDRIDSSVKNYVIGNCVPCCVFCNKSKLNLSQKLFYQKIDKLYHNLKDKIDELKD